MATAEFSATAGNRRATAQGSSGQAGSAALISAADTAVGVVVTNLTTSFTDYDTFAAAVIAITGDTYSGTTKQFTFGGATGLTHAQWATLGALLNTAVNDFKTAQTNNTASKVATAAAVAGGTLTSDVVVYIGSTANVPDLNVYRNCIRAIDRIVEGSGVLSIGSGTPRSP